MARYKFVLAELKERPDSSLSDPVQNIELTDVFSNETVTLRLLIQSEGYLEIVNVQSDLKQITSEE